MARKTLTTPAVVICSRALRESDLLVILFTLHEGKIATIARGAKRSKKRFMNALEPFTHIDVSLTKTRPGSMWFIDSASILHPFESIRGSYKLFVLGSLCLELTDLWCKESASDSTIFELLIWYLERLDAGEEPVASTLIFKTRLLKACGFLPCLDKCKACGMPVRHRHVAFSAKTGEIFCSSCRHKQAGGNILLATAKALDFWQRSDLKIAPRLKIDTASAREGWVYLKNLHCRHLNKEPGSYRLLDADMLFE
jgi:DNA repair protein RecO (recombination protein O)